MSKLDALDCKIILELQKNARMTFSDIAKKINAKPGVVQTRYHKMIKNGIIKGSTLILDYSKIGFPYSCGLEIKVVDSKVAEVARYVKGLKIENTFVVSFTLIGKYAILAIMDCSTFMDVYRFRELIKQHPGVLEVSISVKKTFYYNYEELNSQLLKESKSLG